MIKESELKELLFKEHLNVFEVDIDDDEFYKKTLSLEGENIDELIRFAKVNNINSIFYKYYYTYKSHYHIDEEEIKEQLDKDLYSAIETDIKKHNKEVEKIDFSKPWLLHVFIIYQSQYVCVSYIDYWIDDLEISSSEDKVRELMYENKYILRKKDEENQKKLAELKLEFEEFLLNDSEFKNCTNKNLRRHYMNTVFERQEAQKFKPIFMKTNRFGDQIQDNGSFCAYLEVVWKKFKSKTIKNSAL